MINFKKEKQNGINRPIFYKRVGVWDWIGNRRIASYLFVGLLGFCLGCIFSCVSIVFN
jgi:hypothetical protein